MLVRAEYIWLDGAKTQKLRSKTKIYDLKGDFTESIDEFPEWGFDGSSTYQATGNKSDCKLKPVAFYSNPLEDDHIEEVPSFLVLNEVFDGNGLTHPSNTRAALREIAERYKSEEFMFGVEQEYTMIKDDLPLGFPKNGFPEPQGPYYCGVGGKHIFGRDIKDKHLRACLNAGIILDGTNGEVLPGQWEFQMHYDEPLKAADDLIFARYLLGRIAEKTGIDVSLDPKPVKGDWNGSGAHTNFSTRALREGLNFDSLVDGMISRLREHHAGHIAVYGKGIEERLTGLHETCSYQEFRSGDSDRGASIRIPRHVAAAKKGYLEDRRPCANMDPYIVFAKIMKTICE